MMHARLRLSRHSPPGANAEAADCAERLHEQRCGSSLLGGDGRHQRIARVLQVDGRVLAMPHEGEGSPGGILRVNARAHA